MKNLKTVKTALFALAISLGMTSYANNSDKELKNNNEKNTVLTDGNIVREAKILFKSGKVIEIAYATVEGGKEAELGKEYFSKILPIAAKYGGKMLGSLQVTAVVDGEVAPQMIAIFEWPNIEARDQLLADRQAKKLFPIRDAILTSIKLAYFTVEKDTPVTFREDKTYEFFNAWLTPEAGKLLPEYFKKSEGPKKKYGPITFVASLKPIKGLPEADYLLQPHMAGIVEWNNTNAYYGLMADPEFKKVVPLLKKSLTRIDGIHAKFNFPQ
ncbi:MAG: hypothetical protein V7719_06195 [Psychroserpens sp.]|uniref:hypothetical protein n=1 Tax=Psychroserpens sp. TaxID=2020870 RepID=UPI003001C99A